MSKKNVNDEQVAPWYKQRWLWFIVFFPVAAVVAGIITYKIAANQPHSMVKDDYFKQGLAINQQLALSDNAKALGLRAALSVDHESGLVFLKLTSQLENKPPPLTQNLTLSFSHPTLEKHDQVIQLSLLSDNEFAGELPSLPSALWHVQIHDKNNQWIIKGRWLFPDINKISLTDLNN